MQKQELNDAKKQTSLKNLYFNRYLIFRYFTAAYFFFNLYWLLGLVLAKQMTWVIPAGLLIFLILVIAEQVKQYRQPQTKLPYAYYYYWVQLTLNLGLLLSLKTPLFVKLYPFIKPTGRTFLVIVLLLGIGGCLLLERRLYQIAHNKDRYFAAIKDFEAVIN